MNQPGDILPTTQWTLVAQARDATGEAKRAALQSLCEIYWKPVYVYVLGQGHRKHDAEDLVQGFFADLLSRDFLSNVTEPSKKFRAFLLASINNYLQKDWRKRTAKKRGGKEPDLSIDFSLTESLSDAGHEDHLTADAAYDRLWAVTLVNNALSLLQQEHADAGKSPLFEALQSGLVQGTPARTYAELSKELNTQPNALKVAMHRLKKRFGKLLELEVKKTLVDGEDVQEELRYLLQSLKR